jgi:mono/diheme cytochrome c family protein
MKLRASSIALLSLAAAHGAGAQPAAAPAYSFTQAQGMLKKYCLACHQEKSPAGGFRVPRLLLQNSLVEQPQAWGKLLARVRSGEMPPKGAPALDTAHRDAFVSWTEHELRTAACSDGISPGAAPLKRLNRNEYAATVRDLLNIHINAGRALPADGAGGEGFDNAAETLFISPIHAEKYLEAAKTGIEYGLKDPKSRARFLIAEPNDTTTPEEAARKILEAFLPRAFRRPATEADVAKYAALFAQAQKRNDSFDESIAYALQAILISPNFLFRIEEPNPAPEPRLLDDYALASRLSYFLWGSMPDEELRGLAAKSALQDPEVLKAQVGRMLKDVKALEFSEHFVEQWLNTRELGRDIKPDPKQFPSYYDAEIQSAIRYEPILFFL